MEAAVADEDPCHTDLTTFYTINIEIKRTSCERNLSRLFSVEVRMKIKFRKAEIEDSLSAYKIRIFKFS